MDNILVADNFSYFFGVQSVLTSWTLCSQRICMNICWTNSTTRYQISLNVSCQKMMWSPIHKNFKCWIVKIIWQFMPKEEEEEDKQQQQNQTNKRDRRSEKYTTQLMLLVSILFKCNNIDYFVQTFQYICWIFFHYENNHFCVLYYVYRFIGSMSQQVQNGTNTVAYVVATLGRLSVISSAYVLTLILMHGQSIDKDSAKTLNKD